MPQPEHILGLKIELPAHDTLNADLQKYFSVCEEKLGFLPNVLAAHSFDQSKLQAFIGLYNELMLAGSGLTKLEREMIAVVVSSANRCYYCLTAHGAAVRQLTKDAELGEMLVMNWRTARLPAKQVAAEASSGSRKPLARPTATHCGRSAGPSATSGTPPASSASLTSPTGSPPRST